MMDTYLIQAIHSLRPGSEFSITNNDYLTIHFDVLEGTKPTLAQVNAEIARLKQEDSNKTILDAKNKAALLERLGMTADDVALLLS